MPRFTVLTSQMKPKLELSHKRTHRQALPYTSTQVYPGAYRCYHGYIMPTCPT